MTGHDNINERVSVLQFKQVLSKLEAFHIIRELPHWMSLWLIDTPSAAFGTITNLMPASITFKAVLADVVSATAAPPVSTPHHER